MTLLEAAQRFVDSLGETSPVVSIDEDVVHSLDLCLPVLVIGLENGKTVLFQGLPADLLESEGETSEPAETTMPPVYFVQTVKPVDSDGSTVTIPATTVDNWFQSVDNLIPLVSSDSIDSKVKSELIRLAIEIGQCTPEKES